jgi:very-short-patch-repair endonuclease
VPVVSIWLGDAAECERALKAAGCAIVWADGADLQAVARAWWRELAARRDLVSEAFGFLAGELRESDAQLRAGWIARGARERSMWLDEIESPSSAGAVALLRHIVESKQEPADYAIALQNLYTWLPRPECLGLRGSAGLRGVLALAVERPRLPVVASFDRAAWGELSPRLDDRSRTLLEHGVFPAPIAQAMPPVVKPTPIAQQVREAYERAQEARRKLSEEASQLAARARSEAEHRLYELLQEDPVTRDLFELNVQMPFSFGARRAEIDLACVELRVAVEIDGFYHFQEFDAYRRDRRKDVLLQHQGFLVSRHLADDVMEKPREVVRAIRDLVKRRRRRRRREKAE